MAQLALHTWPEARFGAQAGTLRIPLAWQSPDMGLGSRLFVEMTAAHASQAEFRLQAWAWGSGRLCMPCTISNMCSQASDRPWIWALLHGAV